MKTLQIQLNRENYHYDLHVGQGILPTKLVELLHHRGYGEVFVITNDLIDGIYPNYFQGILPEGVHLHQLVLPDGEQYKTIESINQIYDFLARSGAHRESLLIAFGGGVIGDMVGFAAATYMRGASFLQVPTTLLSQVDSSIGGKTGYNHQAGKNFIGAFKQPLEVIIDVDFLKTLPEREVVAGYAELIKHAFIADGYLFQLLHKTSPVELKNRADLLIEAVLRSLEVKGRIVESDERESGVRAMLNFGHTLAHFIEAFTDFQGCLHGEAVICGMEFAAWYSKERGVLAETDYHLIRNHLKSLGVSMNLEAVSEDRFVQLVGMDKKVSSQGLRFILLESLGKGQIVKGVQPGELWRAYQKFQSQGDSLVRQSTL